MKISFEMLDFFLSSGNKQSRIFARNVFLVQSLFCARGEQKHKTTNVSGDFLERFYGILIANSHAFCPPTPGRSIRFSVCLFFFVWPDLFTFNSEFLFLGSCLTPKQDLNGKSTLKKCSYVSTRYFCCLNLPCINYCRL